MQIPAPAHTHLHWVDFVLNWLEYSRNRTIKLIDSQHRSNWIQSIE